MTNTPMTISPRMIRTPNAPRTLVPGTPGGSAYYFFALLLCLGFASGTRAAVLTWTGAGTDYTWTNNAAANFGGITPANGDDLVFSGATRLNNSNNMSGLKLNSLAYTSSGFTNNGLALTITNGIMDTSGNNTNIIALTLGATQSFTNQAGGNTLVLNGTIASGGFGLSIGGNGNVFLGGVFSGAGFVTMNGGGTLRLAGANTWSNANGFPINSGTALLANAAAIPSGAGRGNVAVANGANLDLGGNSQVINGLDGAGIVGELATNAATYTLTVGTANSNGVFSGNILNNFGIVALSKTGTGTQTLSGASSYVGQTIISQGALVLAAGGSLLSTNFTIASGAQFDVSGAGGLNLSGNLSGGRTNGFADDLIGNLTLTAGNVTMVPGVPGTLTVKGNVNLNGGILNFDLNNVTTVGSGVNDLITLDGGNLDLSGGTTTIRINPFAGSLAAGTYTLINGSVAPIAGGPANLTVLAPRGISATFDTTTTPGSVLMVGSGTAAPVSITWAGNGTGGAWDVNTSQNWLNGVTPDVFYNLDSVSFSDAPGSANAIVSLPGAVSPTSISINNPTNNYTLGVANVDPGLISGPTGLTKTGAGAVTLNAPNNYTGTTTVNGGGIVLGNYATGSFVNNVVLYNGVAPGALVLGNGGVFMTGVANTLESVEFGNITVNAGGSGLGQRARQSNGTPFWTVDTITRNVGGTLDMNNIQQRAGSHVGIYFTNESAVTVNGILGGWATWNLDNWIQPLSTNVGSNPYAGYQTNNATPSAWGAVSNVVVTATPGANLNNATINSLKVVASPTVTLNAGQTLTLASGGLLVPTSGGGGGSATITGGTLKGAASQDLIVMQNNGAGTLTIGSIIADNVGATALTKSGPGTLALTGNNTYTGATYINGASLSGNANGNNLPTYTAAGTLQIGNGGTSGGLSNSASVANLGTLSFNRSDTIGYAGVISGVGALKQLGAGTTLLSADNTYAGVTTISAGTLQIGAGGAGGSISNSAGVANSGTLAFNRTGNYGYGGIISGAGAVTVTGGGTLVLSANNTYLGNTTINGGGLTLTASGSISNSPVITLNSTLDVSAIAVFGLSSASAQQLVGSGVVTGNLTVATSSKLIPAGAGVIGNLSFSNNLALNGGTCIMDVSRSANDQILVAGNLTLSAGTIQVNVVGALLTNGLYKLIRYAGSLAGSTANLTVAGFSQAGQLASLTNAAAGEIDLLVTTGSGASLTWDGTGNTWDFLATDWTNVFGAQVAFHHGDNVRFDNGGAANPIVTLGANVDPALAVVDSISDYAFTGSGKLTASASLAKSNINTLTLQTANDYTGPTLIAGGTLQVGAGGVAGTVGSGNITNNAALNFNEPVDTTVSSAISGTGTLHQQGVGVVSLTGNNSHTGLTTIDSGTTLQIGVGAGTGTAGAGNIQDDGALVFNRSGSVSYGGNITGAGAVTNLGSGTTTLSGVNSYSGNTVIAAGTVKLGGSQVIPDGIGLGNVVLDGGATAGVLDLNGRSETINGLAGVNGAVLGQVLNSVSGTNLLTLGNGDAAAAFSGTIRDNGGSGGKVAVVKIGAGTQTFDVPNAIGNIYSGGTIISNGIVAITSPGGNNPANPGASAVAMGTGPITFYGGTLSVAGSIPQSTTPTWNPPMVNTVIVPANQVGTVNGCQRGGWNPTLLGSGTLNFITAYVRGSIGGDWTGFSGQVVFSGNSNGGNLGVDNVSGFPNARLSFVTNVAFYGRGAGTPIIPIGELSGGDDSTWFDSAATSTGGGGLATLWGIGGLNTSTTFGGRFIDNIGILKLGTGTLALTNANLTYTGVTTVSNGTFALLAPATIPSTPTITLASISAILDARSMGYTSNELDENLNITNTFLVTNHLFTLNSGQTLRGIGRLDGILEALAGSSISPGLSIGSLTVTTNVTIGGAVVMEIDRGNSPNSDKLVSPGITVVTGGSSLTVSNIGTLDLLAGDTFQLFSGPISGSFDAVTLPDLLCANLSWTNKLAVDGSIAVIGTSCVTSTPTNITGALTGNILTLSWPADHIGWTMQTNAAGIAITNAWFAYPGSSGTNQVILTVNPATKNVFYRLVYP